MGASDLILTKLTVVGRNLAIIIFSELFQTVWDTGECISLILSEYLLLHLKLERKLEDNYVSFNDYEFRSGICTCFDRIKIRCKYIPNIFLISNMYNLELVKVYL